MMTSFIAGPLAVIERILKGKNYRFKKIIINDPTLPEQIYIDHNQIKDLICIGCQDIERFLTNDREEATIIVEVEPKHFF